MQPDLTAAPPAVMFFAHAASPRLLAGAEKSLYELAAGLDRRRFRPAVTLPQDGLAADLFRAAGVETCFGGRACWLFLEPPPDAPARWQEWLRQAAVQAQGLERILRLYRPGMAHVNTVVNPLPALVARRLGVPVVWHIREVLPPGPGRRFVLRLVRDTADRVLAVSRAVADTFAAEGLSGKVEVLHNGVPPAAPQAADNGQAFRARYGIPQEAVVVGFAGSLLPKKGVEVFLRMAAEVSPRYPGLFFLVAGEDCAGGAYRRRLELQAQSAGLAGRVVFPGFVQPAETALAAMDVVTVPSLFPEPFCRVAAEAMVLGKPVVAAAVGGLPEVVDGGVTGLLYPAGDRGKFSAHVSRLIADADLRRRMGAAGRERALRRFSLADKVGRVQEIYAELLAKGRR